MGWAMLLVGDCMKRDPEHRKPLLFHHIRFPAKTFVQQYFLNICAHAEFMVKNVVGIFYSLYVKIFKVFKVGRLEENSNGFFEFRKWQHCFVGGQRLSSDIVNYIWRMRTFSSGFLDWCHNSSVMTVIEVRLSFYPSALFCALPTLTGFPLQKAP